MISFKTTAVGQSNPFYCPDGYVTLVKSAYFSNTGAAAVGVLLQCFTAGFADIIQIASAEVPASGVANWEGWIALNPGDGVYLYVGGADVHCWVSGAVLAGPPQFPSATD